MRLFLDDIFCSRPTSEVLTKYNRITIYNKRDRSFDVLQTRLVLLGLSDHNLFVSSNYFYRKIDDGDELFLLGEITSVQEIFDSVVIDNGVKVVNNMNVVEFLDDSLSEIKYHGDRYGFFKTRSFSPTTDNVIYTDIDPYKPANNLRLSDIIDSNTYVYNCSIGDEDTIKDKVLKNIIKKFILDTYLYCIQSVTVLVDSSGSYNVNSLEFPTNRGRAYNKALAGRFINDLSNFKEIIVNYIRSISPFSSLYIHINESLVFIKLFDPISGLNKTEKYKRGYIDYFVFEASRSNVRIEDFHNSTILLLE